MATYDLISTIGPFSDPNDWLNESTQMSGAPGPSDTAVTNGASVTGSGNVGTLDGGLTMNALTLTAQTLMDAGIQVASGSSLTVSGGFSLVSSDNIDVSNGVLTTNGAVTGDVSALTGGIEVDTSGIWIANATVSFSRINSSGNLTAGALSDVSSLQIGGGTATAGSVSAQKYVVVQGAQVTLGAVSILGTPPASLPAFEISNQATVETGAITGNASLAPAGSSNLEVLGSGTTLMVKGDVGMLSGLVAGTSSNTSITGNLEENDLQIGGDDTSNLPTKVGVVGNVDIGTGSSPVSTISQVTEGGDLSLGGVLTIGADAGWNNTLEVNDNSAETGNFGSTSLFPGIVLAKSIDIGAVGIGTLDIESGGGVNASGTVTVGDGSQFEDAVIVNGASSELSAAAMTFPDATATVENGGELFTGDGPIDVSELGDIIVAGGTINGEASIEAFSTIEGFGTLEGQGQNNGAVAANGGTLMLANDWTGTGDFVIQGQSTLYVQAALNSGAFTIDFNLGGPPAL
jgi:hypothetical protein